MGRTPGCASTRTACEPRMARVQQQPRGQEEAAATGWTQSPCRDLPSGVVGTPIQRCTRLVTLSQRTETRELTGRLKLLFTHALPAEEQIREGRNHAVGSWPPQVRAAGVWPEAAWSPRCVAARATACSGLRMARRERRQHSTAWRRSACACARHQRPVRPPAPAPSLLAPPGARWPRRRGRRAPPSQSLAPRGGGW